jgi:RNA polymerase sigma-70 factor (ECF subfamily)
VVNTKAAVEQIVRDEWGQVLAILVRYVRDFDLAEDVLQDAIIEAMTHWPDDGLPHHPRAWLLQTAKRKAIDRFRRHKTFQDKQSELQLIAELEQSVMAEETDDTIPDERLRMLFTCCHPALSSEAQVALTLHTIGGLKTPEIARAFLVPEPTMAQRLTRAKGKIKGAGIPYREPDSDQWPDRLAAVLSVVYLIFNEGYAALSGTQIVRADLCVEAIRLGKILADLAPDEPEAAGLLALMLLHDSRRMSRSDSAGAIITLEEQDRASWEHKQIELGTAILKKALGRGKIGPYQVQAAISAVHAQAAHYDDTDWHEITLLYDRLYALQPNPVIRLNASIALSNLEGPEAGLAMLDELADEKLFKKYQPYYAARADLLRRNGDAKAAEQAYLMALKLSHNAAEKQFLEKRLAELAENSQ